LAFPDITKTGYTSLDLQKLLLDQAKVAIVPGLPQWFGERAEGHIRLSFATSIELVEEGLNRVKLTMEKQ
jgi:bifunctional pyridoxal-dependent enzyme with beta-cystathionase and maltose regulon repressor activities